MLRTSVSQKLRIYNDLEVTKNSFIFFKKYLDQPITLQNKGNLKIVVNTAKLFIEKYPDSFFVWNVFGPVLKSLGNFKLLLKAFIRMIKLNLLSSSFNILKRNTLQIWVNTFHLIAKDILNEFSKIQKFNGKL